MNKSKTLGMVRHLLTFAGGYLVASGTLDENTLEQVVAAAMTLIGAAWSVSAPEKK